MAVDVSVVIPVYNPGRTMDACVEGMLAQTLPADRIEFFFVDDGSDDGGAELLDELATAHANIHAIHLPHSGHPGGPRNVGLEAAQGEYVFFCDHDDWLEPEAFERMLGHARRTGADVLIPKMTGHRRSVPWMLFRQTVDNAVPDVVPVMNALTPHKLFRRSFLLEHGIRFPEGVRLEDHVFMAESYLQAKVITIAADYPYFHHPRQVDGANISLSRPIEPDYYYGCVDRTLDVIDRLTEPGPLRDAVRYRPYHVEMLSRLEGASFLKRDPQWRIEMVEAIRARAVDRFPANFHERLQIARRAAARAMLARDVDGLERLAAAAADATPRMVVNTLSLQGSAYRVDLEVDLLVAGEPVELHREAAGWRVDERLLPRDLDPDPHTEDEVTRYVVDAFVRHRAERIEWFLPATTTTAIVPSEDQPDAHRVVVSVHATVDPETLAAGGALRPGDWDLFVRLDALGLERAAGGGFVAGEEFAVPAAAGRAKPRYNPNNGRLVFAVAARVTPPVTDPAETDRAVPTNEDRAKRGLLGRLNRQREP